jgi:hypothetical protein
MAKNGKIIALSSFKPCGWHNASARAQLIRIALYPLRLQDCFQNLSGGLIFQVTPYRYAIDALLLIKTIKIFVPVARYFQLSTAFSDCSVMFLLFLPVSRRYNYF